MKLEKNNKRLARLMKGKKAKFVGVCDRFRAQPGGEELWQEMMKTRVEIAESTFRQVCNVRDILDEGESWSEYKRCAELQGDKIRFYKSYIGLYFFQTAGFEFIWKL